MNAIASTRSFLRFFHVRSFFSLSIFTLAVFALPRSARAQECVEVVSRELICQNVQNAPTPVYKFTPTLKIMYREGQAIAIAVFNAQGKTVGTYYSTYTSLPQNFETAPSLFIGGALPGEELTVRIRFFNGSSRTGSTDSCETLYTMILPDCPDPVNSVGSCLAALQVEASCTDHSTDYVAVTMRIKNLSPYPVSTVFVTQWDAQWGQFRTEIRKLYDLPAGRTSGAIEAVEAYNTNYTHDPVPFVILAVKGFGDSIRHDNPNDWEDTTKCIIKVWADIPDCRPSSVTEPGNSESGIISFLESSTPNPATGQATITLRLAAPDRVSLVLRDVNGREVMRLLQDAQLTSGTHMVTADVSALPSGTYFYTLESASGTQTRRLTVAK